MTTDLLTDEIVEKAMVAFHGTASVHVDDDQYWEIRAVIEAVLPDIEARIVERCAKVAEGVRMSDDPGSSDYHYRHNPSKPGDWSATYDQTYPRSYSRGRHDAAAAIRSLSPLAKETK